MNLRYKKATLDGDDVKKASTPLMPSSESLGTREYSGCRAAPLSPFLAQPGTIQFRHQACGMQGLGQENAEAIIVTVIAWHR
ncbi:hypothetical protein T265_12244 [Opisthorchis viverrini]|uniref:Uncharacterized protein n=1 Tax=Opisthorchis viverrini TaxID=6198 RepID=A0A074YZ77_OPIVI|nr:hypothetical protein T265_12244 [Opisthorchis viverrini]KER18522.1 hypothetical protein T265_12244 [Opisthorchis viverrini]